MAYSSMELAEVFIKTGEFDDALEALNQQLHDQPHDDLARRMRIEVLMRLAAPSQLQQALVDAQELKDLTANDHRTISILYEQLNQLDDAINAMQDALKLVPQDERFIERYLQLLLIQKQYQGALDLIRAQEPSWRWLQWEGDVLVLFGDDTTATARYGLVLAHLAEREGIMRQDYLDALKARVLLARAHAYRRLGHTTLARDHYLSAQKLVKEDPTISFNLGLLEVLEGNFAGGIETCKAALDNANPALRAEMIASIKDDENYHALYDKLA